MADARPQIPPLTLRDRTFEAKLPVSTAWLLADCMEFRGKQDLWIRQRAELLNSLREQATVQSVESSNRIEGVVVAPARLRPLVLGRAKPRDRSEEELTGYRLALDWIFSNKSGPSVDLRSLLKLHRLAQGGTSGDAGRLKAKDNEIVEFRPGVGRVVRFRPTPAALTPAAVEMLCQRYRQMSGEGKIPPLLTAATFVFDFLCIHPFRDGNGRVSRLLTTLLLRQQGFAVVQYVSLERIVEETKQEYYEVLARCSQKWDQGQNEILPWWNYFLSILRRGYVEFAEKVVKGSADQGKTEMARRAILQQSAAFTLADLRRQLPSISPHLLKKVLSSLKREGQLRLSGRARSARWEIIRAKQ